ncbi:hypothetical protein JIX56_15075 [Streptomyces sp. CA-210063]|uniref:hypothetical protein n=1 Tax=Streptomyces sp. CA-210063 TaxID=2801029 RepID=UPI00214BE39C|nr:hypothetical protein [Streptomyces sp. CA-210063]UUU31123.1 hypothetical protein JIX56_15075 [Streptomyces sp. CA-210063]
MTSRLRKSRARGATSHIAVRLAHTAFGGLAALGWLLLPTATGATISDPPLPLPLAAGTQSLSPAAGTRFVGPVAAGRPGVPGTGGQQPVVPPGDDEASGVDLIVPVAAAGTAAAVAAYSLVRRRRRARLRTPPTGTFEPPVTPLPDLHRRAQRLLVETDDSVRTSTEELRFAAALPGRTAPERFPEGPPPGREDTEPHTERPLGHEDTEPHTEKPPGHEDTEPHTERPPGHEDTEPHTEKPPGHEDTEPHAGSPASHDDTEPSNASPAGHGDAGPRAERPARRDDAEPSPGRRPTSHGGAAPHAGRPRDADPARPYPERPYPEQPYPDRPIPERPYLERPIPERPIPLDPSKAYAETPAAQDAVKPFAEALADARGALTGAFRARQRLDEEAGALAPGEERALLEEILTRCTTAQRRLDTATPAFDQLRALEQDITPALECAEARFRALTGRTATAATTLTVLRDGYAPAASLPVAGHVEQAKDRLVFATTELNRARQAADPGDLAVAAVHLRAAEGAIDQADVFVTGVERLAVELARAADAAKQGAPFTGPYDDPLDVLRRQGRWLLPARSTVAATTDFVTTHRGAVGATARTRLSEAERHLTQAEADSPGTATDETADAGSVDAPHARRAHALAEEARQLAEQDVRAYGNPYGGPVGDGLAGALLGGIILREASGGGGRGDLRGPACYGGTATRARRAVGGQF